MGQRERAPYHPLAFPFERNT
ncbi:protein of unknown function [Streptomyces murinus]